MTPEEVTINIDGKEIKAKKGDKILWVAVDEGIYIPHICAIREVKIPFGGCRLCLVEVESKKGKTVVAACSEPVRNGLQVTTRSDKIDRLRRTALELILSDHQIDCANCPAIKKCVLLKLAAFLKVKVKVKRFKKIETNFPIDLSHPEVGYNPNKCIRCGKCLTICPGFLTFSYYGLNSRITTFNEMPLMEVGCTACLKCVDICPVGAFFERKDKEDR